jgi:hypothetical protein
LANSVGAPTISHGALEHHVELNGRPVAMTSARLSGVKAPQARAQRRRLELATDVRVQDAHLVGRPPERIARVEDLIWHRQQS